MRDLDARLEFFSRLVSNGWLVVERDSIADAADTAMAEKCEQARVPASYMDFLWTFKSLSNAAESRWFLSAEDFSDLTDAVFSWNEFKKMSLSAAASASKQRDVVEFWEQHLPILMLVDEDYQYVALNRSSGGIVHGIEPDFESVSVLAHSFENFMRATVNGEHDDLFFE